MTETPVEFFKKGEQPKDEMIVLHNFFAAVRLLPLRYGYALLRSIPYETCCSCTQDLLDYVALLAALVKKMPPRQETDSKRPTNSVEPWKLLYDVIRYAMTTKQDLVS